MLLILGLTHVTIANGRFLGYRYQRLIFGLTLLFTNLAVRVSSSLTFESCFSTSESCFVGGKVLLSAFIRDFRPVSVSSPPSGLFCVVSFAVDIGFGPAGVRCSVD